MKCDNTKRSDNCNNSKNACSIFSLPPEQFTALATLFGFLIANDLDANEQNSLGNFFIAIGQVLVTIATQKTIFESKQDNKQIIQRLEFLKKNISSIEQELGLNS